MIVFNSFQKIVDYISTNFEISQPAEEAALWFIAMKEAEGMGEYRRKDLAHIVLNGLTPLTPKSVDEEWLQTIYDDLCDDLEEPLAELPDTIDDDIAEELCLIDLESELHDFFLPQ